MAPKPADIFSLFTARDRTIFGHGLDNYHQLQNQIRPEVSLDVQFIARGIGPAVLNQRIVSAQKDIIFKTPGYEQIAAKIANLLPGETFSFLVACGLLEFTGTADPGVSHINSLILGGSELVHCPVCDPHKTKGKVHCPPGHSCPRCHTLRQCG